MGTLGFGVFRSVALSRVVVAKNSASGVKKFRRVMRKVIA
jgi:heme exporter protein D